MAKGSTGPTPSKKPGKPVGGKKVSGAGARAKGARFEHEIMLRLREAFPAISRSRHPGPTPATQDQGDFAECGSWFIEAKKHDKWQLPFWLKTIYSKKREGQPWALIFATHRSVLPESYVTIPLEIFVRLVSQAPDIVEYEAFGPLEQTVADPMTSAQTSSGADGNSRDQVKSIIDRLQSVLLDGNSPTGEEGQDDG